MSSRDRRSRNRSRSRPQRRWNRCPTTGRLQRCDDEVNTGSNRNRNREQSTSRSRSRSRERGRANRNAPSDNATETDNNRSNLNNHFIERFLQDMFGDITNQNNDERKMNETENETKTENDDNALPPIPDNFDQELEEALGTFGARLFEESARLTTRQMDRSETQIPMFVSSLIRDYLRLRAINSIANDTDRRRRLRVYQRDLIERQMEESTENAVVGTDIDVLRQSLNNLRSMMYDTSNQVGQNPFTLQLTIDINNVPTKFEGIVVTRIEIPDEQHRIITKEEEDDNKDNEGFECGICIERFKETEIVTTLKDCNHQFHKQCVSQWIRDKGLCPFCRGKVAQFKCQSDIGTVYI